MTEIASLNANKLQARLATLDDVESLVALENQCFDVDRLSKRSFRRWIQSEQDALLVVEGPTQLLGYGLVWCHKGTRLARLYSIAVSPLARGQGVAQFLLQQLESAATKRGRLYMRLEVAKPNQAAISLYEKAGYRVFGEYTDYYDDHTDALRMQKTIQQADPATIVHQIPWYQQTTEFTCGPASLMMSMAGIDNAWQCEQALELDLWREATTIFMTSGHGGCHPIGLALAAQKRNFSARVFLNTKQPLFIDGVRSTTKKEIMTLVHEQFVARARQQGVEIVYQDITQAQVEQLLGEGFGVLVLISTYQLDGKKAPHWVAVTGIDEHCLYVHDPDASDNAQIAFDCQHVPIAREDFAKMSAFGTHRLRAAVAISK